MRFHCSAYMAYMPRDHPKSSQRHTRFLPECISLKLKNNYRTLLAAFRLFDRKASVVPC